MINKPKIAIISLTSCNGCIVEIVNLGNKLLDILKFVDVGDFPLVKANKAADFYDVAFVEGSVVTQENIKELKKLREKTKFLVALGACAAIGGIPEIKNYRDKNKLIKDVYRSTEKIDNLDVRPLNEYVKIDFVIPGCPPNKNEFYRIVAELLNGKIPKIPIRPVCYECQIREYKCLLQAGKLCLGPLTLGGCEAICLRENIPCSGCRGFLPNPKIEKLKKIINEKGITNQDLDQLLEKFGLKDELQKICPLK